MELKINDRLSVISPGSVQQATITYIDEDHIILDGGQIIIRKLDTRHGRVITLVENGRNLTAGEIEAQLEDG